MRTQFHSQKIKSSFFFFPHLGTSSKKNKKTEHAKSKSPEARIFTWEVGNLDINPAWEILEDGFELARM